MSQAQMFAQLVAPAATKAAAKKSTTKAAPKARTVRKATPAATSLKFALAQGCGRPGAGSALKAHTAAFLEVSGMADGNAFPKAQALKVIGARAVQYHTEQGNITHTDAGLILTLKGAFALKEFRSVDPEQAKAFAEFMRTGKGLTLANPAASIVKL